MALISQKIANFAKVSGSLPNQFRESGAGNPSGNARIWRVAINKN